MILCRRWLGRVFTYSFRSLLTIALRGCSIQGNRLANTLDRKIYPGYSVAGSFYTH